MNENMPQNLYISVSAICQALDTSPTCKNFLDGEKILKSNHLILCKIVKICSSEVHIYALCLQTSALDSPPHTIEGILTFSKEELMVKKIICSCKAGDGGRCKHITAVLLYCNRNDISQLDFVSSTEKKCLWSQMKGPALAQYTPKPLLETGCFTRPEICQLNQNLQQHCMSEFLKTLPESALAKHRKGRFHNSLELMECDVGEPNYQIANTNHGYLEHLYNLFSEDNDLMDWLLELDIGPLHDCCQNFYENNIVNNNPIQLCIDTCVSMDKREGINSLARQRWHQERQYRITGSRCYSIYTYSKNDWEKKALKYFWPSKYCNANMLHGIVTEGKAREEYRKKYNVEVIETGLIIDKKNPWLGYSPDGIVIENGKATKLLEIKCIAKGKEKTITEAIRGCKFVTRDEEGDNIKYTLKKKHSYYGQIQLGLAILNLHVANLIIFASSDDSFINLNIDKDENFLKKFLYTLKMNYFSNMLHYVCVNKKK